MKLYACDIYALRLLILTSLTLGNPNRCTTNTTVKFNSKLNHQEFIHIHKFKLTFQHFTYKKQQQDFK